MAFKALEDGTFIPLEGDEMNVPHHFFTEDELRSVLRGFSVINILERSEHFCLTGIKS